METKNHRHFIDFLFPLTLFLLFASLAVIIILLATGIYKDTANNSYHNNNARLCLAYVFEKVHQNNQADRIHIDTIKDTPVLRISHPGEDHSYYTYIYYKDGYIKELFVKEGTLADLDFGRNISKAASFEIKQPGPLLLSFYCRDEQQREYRTVVGLKAGKSSLD